MNDLGFAEYLWLDGIKPIQQMRSKLRVMSLPEELRVSDFAEWRFDGSYTGQSDSCSSDCILRPVRIYRDPLRDNNCHIVLCEVHDSGGNTHESNQRALLRAAINVAGADIAPWLGCAQRYTLFRNGRPLAFPETDFPVQQGAYYCGVGSENISGRDIAEFHARACISAGILFSSLNALEVPGTWEFQMGYRGIEGEACDALSVADDIWLARYLLKRIGEQYGVHVSFNGQARQGNWSGAGMHAYFSTAYTRDPRCGLTALQAIVDTLESGCCDYIAKYDDCPLQRSSEGYKTGNVEVSTSDDVNQTRTTCIPLHVTQRGYGYLELRRVQAGADPYLVSTCLINAISETTIGHTTYHAPDT